MPWTSWNTGSFERLFRRQVERLFALALEVDRVEEVAKGMGDDKKGALFIGDLAELLQPADAALIALEADGEDVPHVGGDLHPVRDEDALVLLAKGAEVPRLPHAVVLGDVDAGEADPVGFRDEVVGIQHRV